jgi:Zn-dependent peptidase ImmA (M78 family)/DNA-binding XRE family transcriptional regulator
MINGERIRQARETAGMTQETLAEATGLNQSHIALFEQNLRQPKEETIKAIAMATGFPVAFFRREPGPEFPLGSLLYRRRKSMSSKDRERVRQTARMAFEAIQSMGDRFKRIELRLPRIPGTAPADAARITRSELGLSPDSPVTNLLTRLEKNGVIVVAIPHKIDEYDAFSVWADTDPIAPVIVMATSVPGDRQRWNAAHELGHLVLHYNYSVAPSELEDQAHSFAAEFLLPEDAIRKDLNTTLTLAVLAELKSRWGVSMRALIMRAFELSLITDGQRRYLFRQMAVREWDKDEPVPIPPEKPRLLRRLAELIYGPDADARDVAEPLAFPVHFFKPIMSAYASASEVHSGKTKRETTEKRGKLIAMPAKKGASEGDQPVLKGVL